MNSYGKYGSLQNRIDRTYDSGWSEKLPLHSALSSLKYLWEEHSGKRPGDIASECGPQCVPTACSVAACVSAVAALLSDQWRLHTAMLLTARPGGI